MTKDIDNIWDKIKPLKRRDEARKTQRGSWATITDRKVIFSKDCFMKPGHYDTIIYDDRVSFISAEYGEFEVRGGQQPIIYSKRLCDRFRALYYMTDNTDSFYVSAQPQKDGVILTEMRDTGYRHNT